MYPRNLKRIRMSRGLTQQDVADLIGVTVATISSWETGRNAATSNNLNALAQAFNMPVEYLMGARTQPTRKKGPA